MKATVQELQKLRKGAESIISEHLKLYEIMCSCFLKSREFYQEDILFEKAFYKLTGSKLDIETAIHFLDQIIEAKERE